MGWAYHTLQELEESSPSRRDGLSAEQESRWRLTAVNLIIAGGTRMGADQMAIYFAVTCFHRFYATSSFLRCEKLLVAMACLYLGCKVVEPPKPAREVVTRLMEATFGTNNPELRRRLNDRAWLERARQRVILAERAVLYAVGFDFDHEESSAPGALFMLLKDPAFPLASTLHPLCQSHGLPAQVEAARRVLNFGYWFSMQTLKTTLCLQFPSRAVAASCLHLAMKMMRYEGEAAINEAAGKKEWWRGMGGLTCAGLDCITDQLLAGMMGPEDPGAAVAKKEDSHRAGAAEGKGGGQEADEVKEVVVGELVAASLGDGPDEDYDDLLASLASDP
jgi:hypothetical protein